MHDCSSGTLLAAATHACCSTSGRCVVLSAARQRSSRHARRAFTPNLPFVVSACSDEEAFKQSVESITGPITRIISRDGMLGVYNQFSDAGAHWSVAFCPGRALG